MIGLSPVAASGGHSSSRCTGLSLSRPLLLRSTGSRRAGSAVVAHGPSCSAAYGIFPDQGSNPCPLHWQADSQPLRHQESPFSFLIHQFSAPSLNEDISTCDKRYYLIIPPVSYTYTFYIVTVVNYLFLAYSHKQIFLIMSIGCFF